MSELREQVTPNEREEGLRSEMASRSGYLEITPLLSIDIKVAEKDGANQIVDSDTNPREDDLSKEGVLVDELNMDALKQFFQEANVHFFGDPWTVVEQDDFPGSVSISCSDINTALKAGRLVLKKKGDSDTYEFEGLEKFLDEFINKHAGDDKYRREEDEAETE